MLGHHCGMRITEISRLTVADVMHASGKLRSEISMREAITKGAASDAPPRFQARDPGSETYLQYRIERGIGTVLGNEPFRGLLPHPAADLQQPGRWHVAEHQAAGSGDRRAT